MRTKIGQVLNPNCTELEYYFDKSIGHDWSGPQVKVSLIEFDIQINVSALGRSLYPTPDDGTIYISRRIIAIIHDENGRSFERNLSIERFLEELEGDSGYICGWHTGKNEIKLNENEYLLRLPNLVLTR